MGSIVTLKNVRASFLTLGDPERYQNKPENKPRWSATGLVAYDDPQIKIVDKMIEEVAVAKWEKSWRKVLDNINGDVKMTFKVDGKRKDYSGYEGHWALTAHRDESKGRPLVFDTDKSPIYKPNNELYEGKGGRIYSGCYVNLQLEIWAQDNNNGKAIRATLLGIQRFKDGDAFGGGSAPIADDFEEITEGTDADDLS